MEVNLSQPVRTSLGASQRISSLLEKSQPVLVNVARN